MAGSTTAHERAAARVGQLLNEKWRLDGLLGFGGMAAVYAATHRNSKRAAIKVLHPELNVDASLVTRFLREGYLANKVEHPGVVSVFDDGRAEDGSSYLVMELLDGYSLEKHTQASPLPLPNVLRAMDELLDVLAAAHAKGIVHRDIKPANLFLTREGKLKVLDFGIARLAEPSAGEGGFTQTGAAIGTPSYMPPEQARGRWTEVDARTDLWAVGATMLALLLGTRPRRADTVQEELLLAMTQPMPPAASLVPSVPPRVAAVIDMAVAFEREQRFPDARAMQLELRRASDASGAHLESTLVVSSPSPTVDTARVVHPGMAAAHTVPHQPPSWPSGQAPRISSAPLTPAPQYGVMGGNPPTPAPRVAGEDRQLTTGRPLWVAPPPGPAPTSKGGGGLSALAVSVLVVALLGGGAFAWQRRQAMRAADETTGTTATPPRENAPPVVVPVAPPPSAALPTSPPSALAAAATPSPLPSTSTSAMASASASASARAKGHAPPRGSAAPADTSDFFNQRF